MNCDKKCDWGCNACWGLRGRCLTQDYDGFADYALGFYLTL